MVTLLIDQGLELPIRFGLLCYKTSFLTGITVTGTLVSANPPADENAVYLKYLINTAIDFYRRRNVENTGSALAVL
jgi:hypothetical protein